MPDMQKILQTKESIIEIIRQRGPELPVRIANAIGINNLFTAAFMSELVSEQRLKMSNMRVGSSPLYYLTGQEEQLQKYADYLNHKEKEAFNLLKQNAILADNEQEPAIRVALKSIKDFAVPIQIIDNDETKIFWKIHTISNEAARDIIKQKLNPQQVKKEIIEEIKKQTDLKKEPEMQIITEAKEKIKKKSTKKEKIIDTKFKDNIVEYIKSKDIEILQEILIDKKEFISKIRIDILLGKQEFYLISKDKKTISVEEIALALQKAQQERMPALFLSPGKLSKSAQEYLKEWKNLIKFEQVKF